MLEFQKIVLIKLKRQEWNNKISKPRKISRHLKKRFKKKSVDSLEIKMNSNFFGFECNLCFREKHLKDNSNILPIENKETLTHPRIRNIK